MKQESAVFEPSVHSGVQEVKQQASWRPPWPRASLCSCCTLGFSCSFWLPGFRRLSISTGMPTRCWLNRKGWNWLSSPLDFYLQVLRSGGLEDVADKW